ncbi:helix-turn-helix transcriptional regulator [Rhodoferax sp.]|uniref:helix-turn-helix transcriptional regulator n=1 Tax=Rhodoferax sp. TaxID=50421 RepID=UPI00374DCA89
MRRADRLFHLVQLVRGRRLSTAAFLAERLEVSERTVYRDVADLQRQGVPIEGEPGVGYRLGAGFELPPLMFSSDEAKALVAAVRLSQPWLDAPLALAAEDALGKMLSVLPPAARAAAESLALYAPPVSFNGLQADVRAHLQLLREASGLRRKVHIDYSDVKDATTQRTVHPLGCFYWGRVWTLVAWCEVRDDFRSFRIDRIRAAAMQEAPFALQAGRTLADFLRKVAC